MKNKTVHIFLYLALLLLVLTACGKEQQEKKTENTNRTQETNTTNNAIALKIAENPKFKIGSKVKVQADHMKGMKGATGTIDRAYETTAYEVSYTPTTGGEMVKHHKWVIQQEIKGAGSDTLKPGTKITIRADHMEGMQGAKGVVESSERTTVYMIDYQPTTGGDIVKNHRWVTESELANA